MTASTPAHTGLGPCRGTDPREAARIVVGECPDLLFLPELPARGVGAEVTGRTLAMLADLPVDVSPRGWRLAGSTGRPARRAADLLDRDSDALEEADELARDPEAGPTRQERRLQLRVVGPWTLAARLELPAGMPVLTDTGARRDVAASLAEGVAAHAVRLAARLRARPRVILDEALMWHVAAGSVPSPSRFDPVAAVPADRLAVSLCRFADALRRAGVAEVLVRVPTEGGAHAPPVWSVVAETPRDEVPLDGVCMAAAPLYAARSHSTLDAAGTVLGDGRLLHLEGPADAARPPSGPAEAEQPAAQLITLLDRLGAPRYESLPRLVLSPGLDDLVDGPASPSAVLSGVRRIAEAAPRLAE